VGWGINSFREGYHGEHGEHGEELERGRRVVLEVGGAEEGRMSLMGEIAMIRR
jgi:hypothetical protein